jgi:hypothetical protein
LRLSAFISWLSSFVICLSSFLPSTNAADAAPPVTLASLLHEMTDRTALAQWPAPAYACKCTSSYDRRKVNPADPTGWHSNNDHEQFIRTEENEGRKEWVIMDDTGPGAIVRMWTPLWAKKDKQIIRFYFDGSKTPAVTANFNDLLSGRAFVHPPLAFVSWNDADLRNQIKSAPKPSRDIGGDLYMPIPFAKSCKITLDEIPFYYGINYRIYDPGTTVQTFTMDQFSAAQPDVDQTSATLLGEASQPAARATKQAALAAGEELPLDLPAGPAAVTDLVVHVDPKDCPQALRSTILAATFDDQPFIWCPIGEFFGTGARLHAIQDWCRTVNGDGTLTARWVMPYQRSAHFSVRNSGKAAIHMTLSASTTPFTWTDRSMYFHASWHCELGLKTRPMSDWNYLEATGQGVYAGDTLSAYSPVKPWYGEGDERIYIDGEKVASHIGTGTEDYYGYAWGMPNFFNSPFISTPRRDSQSREDWRGYTTTSRLRSLDAIPFRTALKHDMEIWNWADTKVDYAVATFWYARPGVTHNRQPQPQEAAAALRENPGEFKIPGALEFESMRISDSSPNLPTEIQTGALRQGQWSGEQQLFVRAAKPGDFVEFQIPAPDDHPRNITLYGTKSYDYGILRFTINGQAAAKDYDAYDPQPVASGPVNLGVATPKDGKFVLRIETVGTNPASKGPRFYFGLDCIVLAQP